MLMIWPDLFRIIPGATALLSRNTALRLVSSTASQFDSDASCAGPKYPTPALLTRISMGPMDRSVSCTKDTISPARLRSAEIAETLCPLLSNSLAGAQTKACSHPCKAPGDSQANPTTRSRDQCDFAV